MDIHRCRFVPYPPSAINALAFSHPSNLTTSSKGGASLRLAIGRANGDVEIWNPLKGAWYQESILRGGKDRSIEGLAWTQDPDDVDKSGCKVAGKLRLFSIGYSTAVTEWDLATGRPSRHSAGNYGEIWCMAVQPKGPAPKKSGNGDQEQTAEEREVQIQNIAVGCADGAVILLDTSEDDLRFSKILARPSKKKSRVLSITFQNRNTIIAGHADSTIRIYDVRNSQQVRNMTLGSGPKGGPKEILVWSVKCLSDGTIVSGDSTGTASFWDGRNYTLLQRIKSHEADILDLAVSADGNSLFSGGMDRRTTLYRRTGGARAGEKHRWAKVTHQRMHRHDVKAMATFETKQMSILVSGGLDTIPLLVPIQQFGRENHRGLSHLPQQPTVKCASKSRLMMSWWEQEISVWKIPQRQADEDTRDLSPEIDGPQGRKLLAKIVLQGEDFITSADLSSDGSILAISTMSEVKLFKLKPKDGSLKVQKLQAPSELVGTGAKSIHISSDQKWLATVRADNNIQLFRLNEDSSPRHSIRCVSKAVDLKRLPRELTNRKGQPDSLGNYSRYITQLAFSSDSRILAVADISGYIDTWVLEGHEDLTQEDDQSLQKNHSLASSDSDSDSDDEEDHPTIIYGQHWIRNPSAAFLVKLPAAPLGFSFRPSSTPLAKASTNGTIAPHPTLHNPHPHSHNLPNGEDRLFILTAENQIYEVNVLAGKISDWSRRNPTSCLPKEFRDLRDRAMGLLWDVRAQHERVWIHGVNWLWMFDLSRDMPSVEKKDTKEIEIKGKETSLHLKRKRGGDVDEDTPAKRSKHDTGAAGSQVPDSKLGLGIGRKIRKINGAEGDVQSISISREQAPASDEDGDEPISANKDELMSLRRRNGHIEEDAQLENGIDDSDVPDDDQRLAKRAPNRRPAYWHTFKYRPILGIVPLGGESDDEAAGDPTRRLEVALVERPLWDVDLPPTFHGDQEWDP